MVEGKIIAKNSKGEAISEIDLELLRQSCSNESSLQEYCSNIGFSVKDVTVLVLDNFINSLGDIKNKIHNEEDLLNEDWINPAILFNSITNILGNGWYKRKVD